MSKVKGHVRKFLKENLENGTFIDGKTGWFSTGQIEQAVAKAISMREAAEVKLAPKQVGNTLYLMRIAGEIDTIKGAHGGHVWYGMHRFKADPKRVYCTGSVDMEGPQWNKPERRAEQWRQYQEKRGKTRRDPAATKAKNRASAPIIKSLIPSLHPAGLAAVAPASAPPAKPLAETVEEFMARGGAIETLPGVNVQPKHVLCKIVDTRPEKYRKGG